MRLPGFVYGSIPAEVRPPGAPARVRVRRVKAVWADPIVLVLAWSPDHARLVTFRSQNV